MMATGQERQKETYAREQPLVSGETVVPGDYRCTDCDYEHRVEDGKVTNLPVCPRCHGEAWRLA